MFYYMTDFMLIIKMASYLEIIIVFIFGNEKNGFDDIT